jgi:hypothetical protein
MTYNAKIPKEYRSLVAEAERRGWTLVWKRHGHPKLTAPDGYATPVPTSSGSPRLFKAWRSRLLRHPTFDHVVAGPATPEGGDQPT